MTKNHQHLFVYGTLRKGQPDMDRLLGAHAIDVGRGTLQGRLYLVDDFPGAKVSEHPDDRVHGEIYRLVDASPALAALDEYEEYNPTDPKHSLFVRRLAPIRLADGTTLSAWVYLYNRSTEGLRSIPSGDFLDAAHHQTSALA
jgi:gamma-glutamylcyclotransferase (GGCT)/AIG2-like uncharacterized protein YtfP